MSNEKYEKQKKLIFNKLTNGKPIKVNKTNAKAFFEVYTRGFVEVIETYGAGKMLLRVNDTEQLINDVNSFLAGYENVMVTVRDLRRQLADANSYQSNNTRTKHNTTTQPEEVTDIKYIGEKVKTPQDVVNDKLDAILSRLS